MYKVNDRIELHPATDDWMRGDRYGTIEKITRKTRVIYHIRLDKSNKLKRFSDQAIYSVIEFY